MFKNLPTKKGFAPILFVISGLLMASFVLGLLLWRKSETVKEAHILPVKETEETTNKVVPNLGSRQVFTSEDLGITFEYGAEGQLEVKTKIVGNRVYIYPVDFKPENGQFVEIFKKDPNDSLKAAIQKAILAGYPLDKCSVIESPNGKAGGYDNTSYLTAEITRTGDYIGLPDLGGPRDYCPVKYSESNGIGYFLADRSHPDKFLFLQIGQYAIYAGDVAWQKTIKFL